MIKQVTLAALIPVGLAFASPDPSFKPPAQKVGNAVDLARKGIPKPIHGWEDGYREDSRLHYDPVDDKKFISECVCTFAVYGTAEVMMHDYPRQFGLWGDTGDSLFPKSTPEDGGDLQKEVKELKKRQPILKVSSQTWFVVLRHPRQNDVSFFFRIMRDGTVYKLSQTM